MKGLIIWAHSACRSTMGLFREIRKQLPCPVVLAVYYYHKDAGDCNYRDAQGFARDEFADLNLVEVGEDYAKGVALMDAHPGFRHIFAAYQGVPNYARLLIEAKRRRERIGVFSEAPCNMMSGVKAVVKEWLYYPYVLKNKVVPIVASSDFIVSMSGDGSAALRRIGWRADQIIPFGYFPPPLTGSSCRVREFDASQPFTILSTGVLSRYRGADVFVEALNLLKDMGVNFKATITQQGELLSVLKQKVKRYSLPVDFCGFVSMPDLIKLYEACSVFVGSGRHEPWGMRLNDALQCGAPLAVSRGMGGVQLVDEYGCGVSFENGDAVDLAHKLYRLATDGDYYGKVAQNVARAATYVAPAQKAAWILNQISSLKPEWFHD